MDLVLLAFRGNSDAPDGIDCPLGRFSTGSDNRESYEFDSSQQEKIVSPRFFFNI